MADLATSFLPLVKASARVKWDGIPLLVALHVLLAIIQYWWASYDTWQRAPSIGIFLIPLLSMILIFSVASAALPDEVPDEGISLGGYYFAQRRFFWGLFAAYVASTAIGRIIKLALTSTIQYPLVFTYTFVAIALMVLLMYSKNRWVHWAVVTALTAAPLASWMTQTVQ